MGLTRGEVAGLEPQLKAWSLQGLTSGAPKMAWKTTSRVMGHGQFHDPVLTRLPWGGGECPHVNRSRKITKRVYKHTTMTKRHEK